MVRPDFTNLIGIPYSKKDCFEAVRDFYGQVMGIELKHYYDNPGKTPIESKDLIYSSMGDFKKVEGPIEFGDLILIRMAGIECHIAVYLGDGRMFHSTKINGTVIERIHKWKPVIAGYYRVRGNND